ncbi:hypothetical protein T492DRAFT_968736 [Pavlovales sp. CCMP2436]|nr:hypothetical protein T492DRAFT_968736 [Pavlovales sp. CCMP2436]
MAQQQQQQYAQQMQFGQQIPFGQQSMFGQQAPPPMQQAPGAAGWGEHKDPTTGHSYFYNSMTGESSWVRPAALAASQRAPRAGGGAGGTSAPGKGPAGANLFIARAMRRGDVDIYDSAALRASFEQYGTVTRAEISTDKVTGLSKGFGFVSFANVEDADRSIQYLQGQVIQGKSMRIEKTKEDGGESAAPSQPAQAQLAPLQVQYAPAPVQYAPQAASGGYPQQAAPGGYAPQGGYAQQAAPSGWGAAPVASYPAASSAAPYAQAPGGMSGYPPVASGYPPVGSYAQPSAGYPGY